MTVSIRPATPADRPIVEAASRSTFDEHRALQPFAYPEDVWDKNIKSHFKRAFRSPTGGQLGESGNLFVADAGGVMVGYTLLSWHLQDDVSLSKLGSIDDIWVYPDWRKMGVASNLIEFIKSRTDDADWDNWTATVWNGSPSTTLFEEAGFVPQSTTWRYGPNRPAALIGSWHTNRSTMFITWKWPLVIILVMVLLAILVQA